MERSKNKAVVIKKRRALRVAFLLLCLVLAGVFLFVLFMPFHKLFQVNENLYNLCYAVGSFGVAFSLFLILYLVYGLVAKSTALVITDDGIYDFVTGDRGVGFIDKGKITSIRIFGTRRKPVLGIQVDNPKHLIKTCKKSVQDAVLYNLDMNMPAIVINKNDLACTVKEAANIIYEKLNSAPLGVEESIKNSEKISSETKQFSAEKADDVVVKITEIPSDVKLEEESKLAEDVRNIEDAMLSEESKLAEDVRLAEDEKLAEESKLAEEARVAYEAQLEMERLVEEAKLPKYIFPPEYAVKPAPQGEEDASPEPYFVLREKTVS